MKNIQTVDISQLNKDDKFIVDWLSFSFSLVDVEGIYSLQEFLKYIGISDLIYTSLPGNKGYLHKWYFDGININFELGSCFGKKIDDSSKIWIEMSGQGCRNFETFSHLSCWDLLKIFHENKKIYTVNRIDIAFDCFTNKIDMEDLDERVYKHYVQSRFKPESMLITKASKKLSHTIDLGSHSSSIMMRVYDKALERGYSREVLENKFSWIRWEIQLRHQRCDSFIDSFFEEDYTIGYLFKGIILNYFRPVVPNEDDSNMSRWDSPEWFKSFIEDVEKISLYVKAENEYNLAKCERYVYNQAGNALRTLVEIKGAEIVLQELQANKPDEVPTKYQQLINESKTYNKIDDSEYVNKCVNTANYIVLVKEFLKIFERCYSEYCGFALRNAFLKHGKDDYYNYMHEYNDSFKQLSKENQLKYSSLLDDVKVELSSSVILESFIKKYWNNVFFADNLFINDMGVIEEADTSQRIFEFQ